MGRYSSLPILFILAIIQSTIIPEFRIGSAGFDLVLVAVIAWTLLTGMREGLFWAVVGGIMHDLVGGHILGMSSLALTLAAGLIGMFVGEIGRGNLLIPPLAAAAATFIFQGAMIVLFNVFGQSVPIFYTLLNTTLPSALYNMGLILPMIWIMGRFVPSGRTRSLGT